MEDALEPLPRDNASGAVAGTLSCVVGRVLTFDEVRLEVLRGAFRPMDHPVRGWMPVMDGRGKTGEDGKVHTWGTCVLAVCWVSVASRGWRAPSRVSKLEGGSKRG